MKKTILFAVVAFISVGTFAQEKITEGKLLGKWKMTIEMDEVIDELEEEAEEAETILAEVILKSVSGLVGGVMDNIDIYVEFKRGGDAIIRVDAFNNDKEEEDTRWYVRGNKLYIEDTKDDDINWDSNDGWLMKDGILVLDDDDNDVTVYMVKL